MTLDADPGSRRDDRPEGPPGSPAVDRHAAFAAGAPKMSRTVVYWVIAAVLVLGIGGTVIDHFLGTPGSGSPTTLTTTTSPTTSAPPSIARQVAPPANAPQVGSSLTAFLGLTALRRPAPAFALTDAATGDPVSLSGLRGHVVVLTFADAACDDICPVLADELARADAELGPTAVPVTLVTINTDPLDLADPGNARVLTGTGMPALSNWRFLTGTLSRLDAVWKAYNVTVDVRRSDHDVSHTDVLYFVRPDGTLAWSATPFADESGARAYSLPAAEADRFALGIATFARKLAGSS